MDNALPTNVKITSYPGVDSVEEIEVEAYGSMRALAPTKKFISDMEGTPRGASLMGLSIFLTSLQVPVYVMSTAAAVCIADEDGKIDWSKWIDEKSGWQEIEKTGAKHVIDIIMKSSFNHRQVDSAKKDPIDDWNIN